jgi:hypothetical protein
MNKEVASKLILLKSWKVPEITLEESESESENSDSDSNISIISDN